MECSFCHKSCIQKHDPKCPKYKSHKVYRTKYQHVFRPPNSESPNSESPNSVNPLLPKISNRVIKHPRKQSFLSRFLNNI